MNEQNLKILLSPLFLIGLFLLLINDFYLKAEFHNFFTGKLSDFAGLFIFPLFWSAFFPKRKIEIYVFTAIFFVFWKSPFSQILINFLPINRTIDFTDLSALLVLPFSFAAFNFQKSKPKYFQQFCLKQKFSVTFVILFSVFAFSATSYTRERSVGLDKTYQVRMPPQQIEEILQNIKVEFTKVKIRREDEVFPKNKNPDVRVDLNSFFVDFHLKYKICESESVKYSFIMTKEDDITEIKGISADYICSLYEDNSINGNTLTKDQTKELLNVFESEFVDKLQLIPQPKIINQNEQ